MLITITYSSGTLENINAESWQLRDNCLVVHEPSGTTYIPLYGIKKFKPNDGRGVKSSERLVIN